MKKITMIFFLTLLSFCSYGQLALEGFEGSWAPADGGTSATGWFQFENSVGLNNQWTQSPLNVEQTPPYQGQHAAYLQKSNVAPGSIFPEDYLVTPQFNVPEEPELRFYSRLTIPGVDGSIYKVLILDLTTNPTADLNSPASYVELESWTEGEINVDQIAYNEVVVELPAAYVGKDVRIAFMMTGDDMDRWLIDNVKVVTKCLPPATLAASNQTLTTADLSWENPSGSTKWEIEIVGEGDLPTGTGVEYEGTLPYNATALTNGTPFAENTCYKYYVRSLCEGGGESLWAGAFYFCTKRTGDNCSYPIVINALPFSDVDDTAGFGDDYEGLPGTACGNQPPWETSLSGNDVVYHYTATFTGAIDVDLSENGTDAGIFIYNECENIGVSCLDGGVAGWQGDPVSLEDFPVVSGEDYYIVISSYNTPSTPYQLIIQAVACDEPTNLSVGVRGLTSAALSWDNPTAATSWQVAVQPQGSPIPTGPGTTVNDNSDFLWTGLTASTAYQYWVRADCGNGAFSAWAGPFFFNTQICDLPFQCEFEFTMWDQWNSWDGHTMSVKQNGLTLATLTGPGDDGEPVTVSVPLCNNMPVQLFWNAGGSQWAVNEIGISVKNSFGQTIYVKEQGTGSPNTQLYQVVVDCDLPYCLPPENLTTSNPTETTIDLGWDGAATGEWEYIIVAEGAAAPTDATVGTMTTTNPAVGAGPLEASTNYEFYVREHCENASTALSGWAGPFAFSSSVCPPADKCVYNFVLQSSGSEGWPEDMRFTVRQDGTNVAVLGPTFTTGDTMTIPVALCNNVPFELFWNDDAGWGGQAGIEIINNFDQTLFEIPLFSNQGAGSVVYEATVDCLHPVCQAPTDLASANGTMTTIDLSWSGPETGDWEYIVLPAGSPAPTAATPGVATTTNPTLNVPLAAPATNYDFYVRLVCTGAATPTSEWAGPLAIHSEVCNPDQKCMFHFELLSQNGWGYEGNVMTVYQSGVPVAVLGPGFDWSAPSQESFMVDVPLCPDAPIEIFWESEGWGDMDKGLHVYSPFNEDVFIKDFGEGAPGTTIFTGLVSCDPPACLKPQNISVSAVGLDTATIAWDEMGDADSWEVWVLPFGSPAPTEAGTTVNENPVVWPGLTAGTPYAIYVRSNCDGNGFSTWTGPFVFVTAIANDDCDGAINVPVNEGAICTEVVAGTMSGATSSAVIPSCNWDMEPEYDVWYSFTATNGNHVVTVNDGVNVQMGVSVYSGACGDLTELECNLYSWDDQASFASVGNLTIGETYYIHVFATSFPNPEEPSSFNICISSPASIRVDGTMAVEDIVNTALVVESCATFENITWSTGTNFVDFNGDPITVNGIGYFEKGLTTFGIEEGVVLMTGDVNDAPGPNIGAKLGGGNWPGDTQLFDYMTGLGIDVGTYNDATVLEFDFTPLADKLKFPFVFASEEYGTFQCSFSDAFAFFLTPLNDDGTPSGPTTNLAVVPETNSPVSVVTIRDEHFSPFDGCTGANEAYFADYYGKDAGVDMEFALDGMLAPINFQGFTVRMSAESDVVAGQKYHIKLVIADRGDSGMDSAVFIGAFDIGKPDLGVDLTIADGNGVCAGAEYTIVSDLDPEDYTFTWLRKDVGAPDSEYDVIEGETGVSLTVTTSGEYKINASFGGLCEANDTVVVEFYPEVFDPLEDPTQLIVCDADGIGTFNLQDNIPVMLVGVPNPADYTFSFHLTQDDATANLNPLPLTNYENVTPGLQVIYVRAVDSKGCVGIHAFELMVQDLTPFFAVNQDFDICEGSSATITVTPTTTPANYDPATVTYAWTLDGNALPDTTASITATAAGLYEVTVNNQGCPGTDSVVVTVIPTPVVDEIADVVECAQYTLPALSADNHYFTGTGGTGTELLAGAVIETSQEIFVYAFNANTPECSNQSSFNVTLIPTPVVTIDKICNGNDFTLVPRFDADSNYTEDTVSFAWTWIDADDMPRTSSASTLVVTDTGTYTLVVTPTGVAISCPLTIVEEIDNTTCLIPRGISPDGDGRNDEFDLSTLDVKELKIYNRYGQEVYSRRDYTNEWVGQENNGNELPTGTYYYMFERSNGETKTGWVYINRQD